MKRGLGFSVDFGDDLAKSHNYRRLHDNFSSNESRVEGRASNFGILVRHLILLAEFGGKGER